MDRYLHNITVIVLVLFASLFFFEFYVGATFGMPHVLLLAAGIYAITQNIAALRNINAVYKGSTKRLNHLYWFN